MTNIEQFDLPKTRFYTLITNFFTHNVNYDKQAASFKMNKLRQFEGAKDKSEGEIILNFFPMARRNLLVIYRNIAMHNVIFPTH